MPFAPITPEEEVSTLVTRVTDDPGAFAEGVQLLLGSTTVQMQTPSGHFRRPMALSRVELHALELGLAAWEQESPPDERGAMVRARERLRRAISAVRGPDDPTAATERHLALGGETDVARLIRRDLQHCIRDHRVATIAYRGANAAQEEARRVQPLGVVWSRGSWFLVAWCERSEGIRVFRLDRIASARCEPERFTPSTGFSLESVLRAGKVLVGTGDAVMRVRYTPKVARWIAEREAVTPEPDGSVLAEYPLLDREWGVRQALRYGADVEVLEPADLRAAVVERLSSLAT